MKATSLATCAVAAVAVAMSPTLIAQGQQAKPAPAQIKVDVTLMRLQGDKKVGSLPFSLWATDDGRQTSLRVGVDVPVGTTTQTRGGSSSGGNATMSTSTTSPSYRNLGTDIDCSVSPTADSRYMVYVNMVDTSIFDPSAGRQNDLASRGLAPTWTPAMAGQVTAFRTFQLANRLTMRDGQTLDFATATDKITGDVLKLEVTISVSK
jgi:hypothetical protein